jgi:N,N'-diacetyllegionaminate synthase
MRLFGKTVGVAPIFVAEVGVNHEGDPHKAIELLRLAAEAGADAVKFQTYTPSRFISSENTERFERVSRFRLGEGAHRRLADEAARIGIAVFSTAVSDDVVPFVASLFPAIKIASGDIDFEPVIRAAARQVKPLIVSVGNATLEEVDQAVEWVRQEIRDVQLAERLILLQCTGSYPAPIEDANLAVIPMLRERYGVPVGYSNHVLGAEACLAAVALGACLLEIHFTDQKEGRTFRDHQLSLTAPELRSLIESARRVHTAVGSAEKAVQPSEQATRFELRKGIVAARDLTSGIVIRADDLSYARPAIYFRSGQRDQLIGRTLKRSISAGASIRPEDLG